MMLFCDVCRISLKQIANFDKIIKYAVIKIQNWEFKTWDVGIAKILQKKSKKLIQIKIHNPCNIQISFRMRRILETQMLTSFEKKSNTIITVILILPEFDQSYKFFSINKIKNSQVKKKAIQERDINRYLLDFFNLKVQRRSLLFLCNYKKYGRKISNSSSFGKIEELDDTEGILTRSLRRYTLSSNSFFLSCGREDKNVLLLNRGRLCVIGMKSPQIILLSVNDNIRLEKKINNFVRLKIENLCMVNTRDYRRLKLDSRYKTKSYRSIIYCKKYLNKQDLFKLNSEKIDAVQWTPIRVLHRRSNLARLKNIINLKIEFIKSPNWIMA